MNEGHAGFLGVERIRELITDGGIGLRHRADRGALRHRVHHAHPGARRHRPVPGRDGAALLRRPSTTIEVRRARRRAAARRADRPDPRARRRGRPGEVQHGAHGSAAGPARQRGVAAARPGEPGHVQRAVARLRRRARCRSARSPTACTRATWAAPQWLQLGRELAGSDLVQRPGSAGCGCSRSTPGTCGGSARSCARCWSTTSGRGCAARGWSAAPRTPNWAGSQRLSIPRCSPSGSPGGCRPTSG